MPTSPFEDLFRMFQTLQMPGGGDVWQNYHPMTSWFSPQNIHIEYEGDRQVENAVTARAAGYGRQLDALQNAVLAMACALKADQIEQVKALREMVDKIDEIKALKKEDLKARALKDLMRLGEMDRAAYHHVIGEANSHVRGVDDKESKEKEEAEKRKKAPKDGKDAFGCDLPSTEG